MLERRFAKRVGRHIQLGLDGGRRSSQYDEPSAITAGLRTNESGDSNRAQYTKVHLSLYRVEFHIKKAPLGRCRPSSMYQSVKPSTMQLLFNYLFPTGCG